MQMKTNTFSSQMLGCAPPKALNAKQRGAGLEKPDMSCDTSAPGRSRVFRAWEYI